MKLNLISLLLFSTTIFSQNLEVEKLTEPELQKIISERDGKILLINVWATWCIPCREEFPDLVKLRDDTGVDSVDILGISADYPDEVESKVIPFLEEQNVNFKNYVNAFDDPNKMIDFLNPDWSGALPATFVFDKNGNPVAFLQGKQSYKELIDALNF